MTHGNLQQKLNQSSDFVSVYVGDQLIGMPILKVRDILGPQKITRIPLAPPEILGALNLRGRIVTVIDLRLKFGLTAPETLDNSMNIVIEHKDELYSLLVDRVGEVLTLVHNKFEQNPGTLEANWRELSSGVYQLENCLLISLDIDHLFASICQDPVQS